MQVTPPGHPVLRLTQKHSTPSSALPLPRLCHTHSVPKLLRGGWRPQRPTKWLHDIDKWHLGKGPHARRHEPALAARCSNVSTDVTAAGWYTASPSSQPCPLSRSVASRRRFGKLPCIPAPISVLPPLPASIAFSLRQSLLPRSAQAACIQIPVLGTHPPLLPGALDVTSNLTRRRLKRLIPISN